MSEMCSICAYQALTKNCARALHPDEIVLRWEEDAVPRYSAIRTATMLVSALHIGVAGRRSGQTQREFYSAHVRPSDIALLRTIPTTLCAGIVASKPA